MYPCVGTWLFLLPSISRLQPAYSNVLKRASSASFSPANPFTVLDLGCCFGQDLRRLAADGLAPSAPPSSTSLSSSSSVRFVAIDLHRELWDLGFELFRDRELMQPPRQPNVSFVQADWLEPSKEATREIEVAVGGGADLVIACQFLHLFSWAQQVRAATRIVSCTRAGAVVMGYQVGGVRGEEKPNQWGE